MKNKKAFTLIELIAVLVILAILALIVTPIVLNIVKHAKESANKRSVDAYGKSIELAVANYLLDKGKFPTNISDLEIEYSGKEVICNISLLNEDSSVYLSECKVGSSDVKDKNTSDGWYHYGKSTKVTYKAYKTGYSARLITFDELTDNLGYIITDVNTWYTSTADVTPSWVYKYEYWTMSQWEDSTSYVWFVGHGGGVGIDLVYATRGSVRPVITIKKSAI